MTEPIQHADTTRGWLRASVISSCMAGTAALVLAAVSLMQGATDLLWLPVATILYWGGYRSWQSNVQALPRAVGQSAALVFVWGGLSHAPWGSGNPPEWLEPAGYPAARELFLGGLLIAWVMIAEWGKAARSAPDWPTIIAVAFLVAGRVWPCANWVDADYLLTDEGTILANAVALLQGERLYVDRFEFLWPGTFLLAAALFQITGRSLLAIRATLTLLIVLSAVLSYDLIRRFAGRGAALVGLFLVMTALSPWAVYWSHHWVSTATAMVAVWCLARDVPARRGAAFGAGLAIGLTMLCMQHKGVGLLVCLVGVYTVLLLEVVLRGDRKASRLYGQGLALMAGGVVLVITVMFGWLLSQGSLAAFHYATWTWLFEGYGPANRVPLTLVPRNFIEAGWSWRLLEEMWRDGTSTVAYLAPLGIPLAVLILLFPASGRDRRRWFVLFAGCLGVFSATLLRYQYLRLAFAAPATCALLAAGAGRLCSFARNGRLAGRLARGLGAVLIAALLVSTTAGQARYVSNLPTWGFRNTAVGPLVTASFGRRNLGDLVETLWFMNQLPAHAKTFVYPIGGGYYLLTGRRNPTRYFFVMPDYNRTWQIEEVVESLDSKQVEYFIWDKHYTPQWVRAVYPHRRPDVFENNAIIDYLNARYVPILELDTVTVYKRQG